jgi:S-adenosylmethionine synthetase
VNADFGIDASTCAVLSTIDKQSPDIAQGVNTGGAGDQGMMFGFACDETPELMPAPIRFAHRMMEVHREKFESGEIGYLRPDAKSQVSVEYDGDRPVHIPTVVLSSQHEPDVSHDQLRKDLIDGVLRPSLPGELVDRDTIFHVNPTGRFVVGGPLGDAGLTGRKIIVDTYGGMGRHGGGCFSGKDPSKVDRSAAYAARWVAKNLVAAGLARRCEVQLAYAIGVAEPVSIRVESFGTGEHDEATLDRLIRKHFDLTPSGIIDSLDLLRPIYRGTSYHGHFGRENAGLPWEETGKAEALRRDAGK